ncbi:hypothetical protein JOB18_028953 [Solea senegalensis]|uniref:Uncharacterized protein n=1 Tax=Solea senegalensis TaxID=28829 RepID=A0AAV6PKN0_SOLSE|nr:hypothetical protein JOB18_028953 [Solea senegalensis]
MRSGVSLFFFGFVGNVVFKVNAQVYLVSEENTKHGGALLCDSGGSCSIFVIQTVKTERDVLEENFPGFHLIGKESQKEPGSGQVGDLDMHTHPPMMH